MNKTLVAYFSVTGTTAKIADQIATAADAALFEIEPVIPYTREDINWRDNNSRANKEHADQSLRVEIKDKVVGMEDYSTLIIGFPIWWHTCPNIIRTFLDSYGLDHKKIALFATSGGSGISQAEKELKAICPSSVEWLPGKVFNNNPGNAVIRQWVNSLGL